MASAIGLIFLSQAVAFFLALRVKDSSSHWVGDGRAKVRVVFGCMCGETVMMDGTQSSTKMVETVVWVPQLYTKNRPEEKPPWHSKQYESLCIKVVNCMKKEDSVRIDIQGGSSKSGDTLKAISSRF